MTCFSILMKYSDVVGKTLMSHECEWCIVKSACYTSQLSSKPVLKQTPVSVCWSNGETETSVVEGQRKADRVGKMIAWVSERVRNWQLNAKRIECSHFILGQKWQHQTLWRSLKASGDTSGPNHHTFCPLPLASVGCFPSFLTFCLFLYRCQNAKYENNNYYHQFDSNRKSPNPNPNNFYAVFHYKFRNRALNNFEMLTS